ncbi:hypothetical protein [Malonomonas rubra]|nr:hypothetical protein [Malonomonas rubra]
MQVGFFTCGVDFELPHPKISPRTLLLLCRVIQKAWQALKENPPSGFDLETADEDTITQILVDEIIERVLRKNGTVDGFNCALFGRVTREPKISNYNKKHPDKMPDIHFDLRRDQLAILSDQDGLFVECKPVDSKHTAFSCYCKKGLIRFVNGDYAWAMQNALMVGYVKKPYSFKHLASALDGNNESINLKTIRHSPVPKLSIYSSNHRREFEWPGDSGSASQIEVLHLWLQI